MIGTSTHLPLLPAELLQRHHCHEPYDTRFRAAARLLQTLWRERNGYPCGRIQDETGGSRRLGSRLTKPIARSGVNLIDPELVPFVRREIAYREIGAAIDTDRLWGNLLSSQPLTFSLFGPMKRDLGLATAVFRKLAPDLVAAVTGIFFEHSPGRGDPRFTDDFTAFDALIQCTTPTGRAAFIAIEMKYSEGPSGVTATPRDRYDVLSRTAGVYQDPDSPLLRAGGIEQLWREQLLATAMVQQGLYEQGRFIVIAPALNRECQNAVRVYESHLSQSARDDVAFQSVSLEQVVTAIGEGGAQLIADRLTERYLDFSPVHAVLADSFGA